MMSTLTNSYSALFLTEDGLYEVLLQSKKPIAKAFKREVKIILKDIRKHGMYMTPAKVDEMLSDPDTWIRMLTAYKEEKEAREQLQIENAGLVQTVEEQALVIEEQAPKVVFADAVADSNDTILMRDLAKILKSNGVENMGQNRLFEALRANGFIMSDKHSCSYNTPTQKAMELGLFKVKKTEITHSDGRTSYKTTTKVTGKGQTYFVNYFLNGNGAKLV